VAAGLDAGLQPVEALVDAEWPALQERLPQAEAVAPELMASLSTLPHPARVIAVFRRADLPSGELPVRLALWRVSDPGNVGTLIRAADALGPASVLLSSGCADPTGPKALRASAGAVFRTPLGAFEAGEGAYRVALAPRDGVPLPDLELPERVIFVLGAEREGLPAEVVGAADAVATIPQAGRAESLNVATAGAIALYEWRRRSAAWT
jgi:RNA methyltransferase, TrmH family